jgi:hypothetical protein
MNRNGILQYFNGWVLLGALGVAGIGILLTLLGLGTRTGRTPTPGLGSAHLTLIPAPSSTPFIPTATPAAVFTSTPTPPLGEIAVGGYVQIAGTDGEGLRLRAAPGLGSDPLFMGFDAEVFEVRDGPQEADGYTWWYLVAPYDESRAGWAAANYLTYVPPSQ